jgi:hypothetical protein
LVEAADRTEFLATVGAKDRALLIAGPIGAKPDLPDWVRKWCARVITLAKK